MRNRRYSLLVYKGQMHYGSRVFSGSVYRYLNDRDFEGELSTLFQKSPISVHMAACFTETKRGFWRVLHPAQLFLSRLSRSGVRVRRVYRIGESRLPYISRELLRDWLVFFAGIVTLLCLIQLYTFRAVSQQALFTNSIGSELRMQMSYHPSKNSEVMTAIQRMRPFMSSAMFEPKVTVSDTILLQGYVEERYVLSVQALIDELQLVLRESPTMTRVHSDLYYLEMRFDPT